MKGLDLHFQRLHSETFNAGSICRHCGHDEEAHPEVEWGDDYEYECENCDCLGFEARDPRDDEQDDPGYYED